MGSKYKKSSKDDDENNNEPSPLFSNIPNFDVISKKWTADEKYHALTTFGNEYDDEVSIQLANGKVICTGIDGNLKYIRIVESGCELALWGMSDWKNVPTHIMTAIIEKFILKNSSDSDERSEFVTLNDYDYKGDAIESSSFSLTRREISKVVNQSSQLVLAKRNGEPLDEIFIELEVSLVSAELIELK